MFVSAAKEDRKKWAGWTDRFVKDFPGSTAAHYMRGDALARVGKLDKACKSYGDALKIHENFSLARTRWGIAELLRGRKNEGLRAQNNAVSDGQCKLAACYAALGTYYAESPCAEAALECFQAALKLDPNFALAYNGRGCAYYGMGKPHEAYRDFEIAQRLCPAVAPAAAANQGFVRAMVEKKVAEKLAKSHTGTTLRTKSQVIGVDTLGSKVRQGRAGQKPRDFTQMGVKQTLECAGRAGYDRALSQIRQQQRALLSEIDRIHHDIDVGTRRTVGLCNATILGAEAVKFGVDAVQLGRTLAAKKVCEFTMKSAFSLEKDLASLAASDLDKPEGSIVKTGRAGLAIEGAFDPAGALLTGAQEGAADLRRVSLSKADRSLLKQKALAFRVEQLSRMERQLVAAKIGYELQHDKLPPPDMRTQRIWEAAVITTALPWGDKCLDWPKV